MFTAKQPLWYIIGHHHQLSFLLSPSIYSCTIRIRCYSLLVPLVDCIKLQKTVLIFYLLARLVGWQNSCKYWPTEKKRRFLQAHLDKRCNASRLGRKKTSPERPWWERTRTRQKRKRRIKGKHWERSNNNRARSCKRSSRKAVKAANNKIKRYRTRKEEPSVEEMMYRTSTLLRRWKRCA